MISAHDMVDSLCSFTGLQMNVKVLRTRRRIRKHLKSGKKEVTQSKKSLWIQQKFIKNKMSKYQNSQRSRKEN